ncbi:hypothetical protein AC481_07410 [miscellaneous Crenarchaeota group archaeon SMTZ-80]|nr:MAG: hypothetical protein AC481_07410 [miscellaneous Crenarchaeota group archaeon SMTZ-80]
MGCSEWLQLEPESDLIREEFWRTGEDVEAVIAGVYSGFAGAVTTCFKWGELRGDVFIPGNRINTDDRNIMNGYIYPENTLTRWYGFYGIINYANTVLEFSPVVEDRDDTFTQNESKAFQAEALFARALCYFYLMRTFRDVPLILKASITDSQEYYPEKTTEENIILQIIDDLKIALEDLPTSYGKLEYDKGRATKGAVNALLADVYLYNEQYEECIEACDNIINSGLYALIDGESWFSNFFPGNSNESIFEIQFDKERDQTNLLYSMAAPYPRDGTYPDGNDEFRFSPYLVEIYREQEGDRRAGSNTYFPFNERYNHYILWKYIGTGSTRFSVTPRNGNRESDANWIIYRYADILLLKAEASVQTGDLTGAIELVNQVRYRAGVELLEDISNKSVLEEIILEERVKELAGEGKRWYDLIRFGRRNNFERKDKFIDILTDNKSLEIREILKSKYSDPDSWYLPIFQDEIDQNINLEQNEYYINQ